MVDPEPDGDAFDERGDVGVDADETVPLGEVLQGAEPSSRKVGSSVSPTGGPSGRCRAPRPPLVAAADPRQTGGCVAQIAMAEPGGVRTAWAGPRQGHVKVGWHASIGRRLHYWMKRRSLGSPMSGFRSHNLGVLWGRTVMAST